MKEAREIDVAAAANCLLLGEALWCMLKSISHIDQDSGFEPPALEMGCLCMLASASEVL